MARKSYYTPPKPSVMTISCSTDPTVSSSQLPQNSSRQPATGGQHPHHHISGMTTSQTTIASSTYKPPLSPPSPSNPFLAVELRPSTPASQIISRTGGQLGVENLIANGGGAQGLRRPGLEGEDGSDLLPPGREGVNDLEMARLVGLNIYATLMRAMHLEEADFVHVL